MTVNEFLAQLEAIGVTGDESLCVHAFGGLPSSGFAIENVAHGFDWNKGKVLIFTERQLTLYVSPEDKKASAARRRKLLKEIKELGRG